MTNALSIVKDSSLYLPNADELHEAINDLQGLIKPSTFGQITIAGAGACTFNVREAGEPEATPGVAKITGVIVASNQVNICWEHDFNTRDDGELPLCRSVDGVTGMDRNGCLHDCGSCPRNQFSQTTGRKQCANQRRLYIMRPGTDETPGDLVPIIMTLPPSALKEFDNYRIRCRLTERTPIYALVTEITLKPAKSKNGKSTYSRPIFTPVGKLPKAEAEKIAMMVSAMMAAAQQSGSMDDYNGEDAVVTPAPNAGFKPDSAPDEELPF